MIAVDAVLVCGSIGAEVWVVFGASCAKMCLA